MKSKSKYLVISLFIAILFLELTSCKSSQGELVEYEKKSSEALSTLTESCLVCHSANEMQRGPSLEALRERDIIREVKAFQRGDRGRHKDDFMGLIMAEAVESLQEDDLSKIAKDLSTRASHETIKTVRGDSLKGQKFYQQLCASCHGVNARGTEQGNALWTLEDWYLLAQMRKFKQGIRAYGKADHRGLAMRAAVSQMDDQDMKNVIKYISDTFSPGS